MKRSVVISCVLVVLVTGCGGGGGGRTAPTPTQHSTAADASTKTSPDSLERAVRTAINEHHRLSVRVLWTNHVPPHPNAIGGPALTSLREAVAQRRRQHIRIRLLSERFRILSVRLDPSYTSAKAVIVDVQRTQPQRTSGRPIGKSIRFTDRAHLLLRRSGAAPAFVVWKVDLTR